MPVTESRVEEREAPASSAALRRGQGGGLAAWRAFLTAHAAIMRRLEADLDADQHMSVADFDVLIHLSSAPEHGLRMSELADLVLLSRSGMTRRVDRLETAGLVCRRDCDADRRGAYAVVTDEGLERLRAAVPTHLRGVDEHFLAHLAPGEMAMLTDVMGRLAARAIGTGSGRALIDCEPATTAAPASRPARTAAPASARRDH